MQGNMMNSIKQEHTINIQEQKKSGDIEVLARFIEIYCTNKHSDLPKDLFTAPGKLAKHLNHLEVVLCNDCRKLLLHAASKRFICPYEPKPACKKCTTHCYAPGYREKIREVMRFSGMYLIKRGRIDLMKKYFM